VVCKLVDKQVESFKFMATPIIHRLLLKVCLLLSPFFQFYLNTKNLTLRSFSFHIFFTFRSTTSVGDTEVHSIYLLFFVFKDSSPVALSLLSPFLPVNYFLYAQFLSEKFLA